MTSPTTPELRRLALLRAFKMQMLRPGGENVSPFADSVATAHADSNRVDLADLHAEVREGIVQLIEAVRKHQRSQVILLSGEAGSGKSHILRSFAPASEAESHGYFFVGGSNDWKVDEFQACLLDWMIQSLTTPSTITRNSPLHERVSAIGFRAVGQLLDNRTALKRCLARRRRGFLGRLLGRGRASFETIEKLTKSRDPRVFEYLDFTRFTDEVCSRFLAEPGNPVHRYALRVLLCLLFPDKAETGVGTPDRVIHWFRRKPDDGYWVRRMGVADDLVKRYQVGDAIKLLIHLFSPELSKRLSIPEEECQSRVFLFVFDQAEGRDELFDSVEDWNRFFAHLSELYNTLPNVLVIFTMTIGLRNELHPKMERQFKDRIRKDERFVLRQPTPEQVCELYRCRIAQWFLNNRPNRGLDSSLSESEQYLPFGRDRVAEIGGNQSVRGALEAFDREFHAAMKELVIEPPYDFEFFLNEQNLLLQSQSDYDYTANHLDTVLSILGPVTDDLNRDYPSARLTAIQEEWADNVRTLKLSFSDPVASSAWVCIYLTRFATQYTSAINKCDELLLRNRQKARYSLWMVRPRAMSASLARPDQMFTRVIESATEARLRAAKHLLDHRLAYEANGNWPAAWDVVRREIESSYLGELLIHARERLSARVAGGVDESVIS